MKKRNVFLAVVKLLFCCLIILMHWNIPSTRSEYMFEGGYLFVDFFFILQGFFLVKDWNKEDSFLASKQYLVNRLYRFFPVVFSAGLIMLILQFFKCVNTYDVVKLILQFILQISFISQFFPMMQLGAGGIFWFLSATVIAGTLLVCICKAVGKRIIFILPVISAVLFNAIYTRVGSMDVWYTTVISGTVGDSLLRATADICVGIVAKEIADSIKTVRLAEHIVFILRIMNVAFVILMVYLSIYCAHSKMDFYGIFIFAVIIIVANIVGALKNSFIVVYLDKICMPMYVFQVVCIMIASNFVEPSWLSGMGLLFLDFVLSSFWILIEPKVDKHIFCKNCKVKNGF